jgi:hypothetical protein
MAPEIEMMQWAKRALGIGLLMSVGGVSVVACTAENQSSVFIRQVLVPSGGTCSVTADPGGDTESVGVMDVMLAQGYQAELLIGNQLVERGSAEQIRTETSRFVAERAEVKVVRAGGGSLGEYSMPVSGFADPGTASTPGWGVVSAVLVSGGAASTLRGELQQNNTPGRLVASVRIVGHTLGGQEEKTGWYDFPVDYCYGCLLYFPPDADNPALDGVDCLAAGDTAQEMPCRIGQDEGVDCRACHAAGLGDICEPK